MFNILIFVGLFGVVVVFVVLFGMVWDDELFKTACVYELLEFEGKTLVAGTDLLLSNGILFWGDGF